MWPLSTASHGVPARGISKLGRRSPRPQAARVRKWLRSALNSDTNAYCTRSAAVTLGPPAATNRSNYLAGLISTMLNPKPALFFLSYLPQFIDRSDSVVLQVAFLAGIHIVIGFVWLTLYAWLVSRLQLVITRPRVKAAMERISGVVLVALGIRVAFER